jgi:hypothetical protein
MMRSQSSLYITASDHNGNGKDNTNKQTDDSSGNEAVDQSVKDVVNEEIGNQEPYPSQDLMKSMKKEEFNNRQIR